MYLEGTRVNGWRSPGDLLLDAPDLASWYEVFAVGSGRRLEAACELSDNSILTSSWDSSGDAVMHKSTDHGVTWDTISLGLEHGEATDVYCIMETFNKDVFIGLYPHGRILKSTDGGESWDTTLGLIPGGADAIYDLIEVEEAPGSYVLWAGHSAGANVVGVSRSEDGGSTWVNTSVFDTTEPGFNGCRSLAEGGDGIYASPYNTPAPEYPMVVFKTTNHGDTWENIGEIESLNDLYVQSLLWAGGQLYAGTGLRGRVFVYEDSQWVQTGDLPLGDGYVNDLIQADNGDLYATLAPGRPNDWKVYRSASMGDTWDTVATFADQSIGSTYDIVQGSDGTLYDGANQGKLMNAGYFSSGDMASSVYDTRSILTEYGRIYYDVDTTNGGHFEVRVRTMADSGMSDAPDWDSCSTYSSGESLPRSGFVDNGERYIQYQVRMRPDDAAAPNWSPVLKWIRFGYSHPRLTSSSSGATAYPQGRKLLRVPDADPGNIWICYEDSGKIYVAQSLDGGSGWVEKACVSGEINTVQCRYPCMAVSPPPPTTAAPDVYWIEELKRLWAAQKDTGGNWSEPVLLVDGDCYPVNYGQPSAAISPTDGNVHIAFACDWYDPDTVRSEIRHGVWDRSDYSSRDLKDLTVVDVVYGASDSCSAPSLEFDENEGLLHLTYARANRIWSRYWPYGQQEPYTWSAAALVSDIDGSEYPFVNADDSLVYAVWSALSAIQPEVWWKFKRIDENLWPAGNGRNISGTDNSESRYPSVLHGIYATWCQDTTPGDWEIAYKEYPWQEPWTNISETPARSAYSHMEIQYEGKTTTGFFLWTDGNFPPYTIMVKPWVISSLGGGLAVGQDVFPGPISERAGEKSPRILVYPNPAADELVVRYSVQEGGPVNLRIFDASGRLVRTLNLNSSGGGWSFQKWDGCDEHAQRLPPGTYFLRLTATPDGPTAKLVLVR